MDLTGVPLSEYVRRHAADPGDAPSAPLLAHVPPDNDDDNGGVVCVLLAAGQGSRFQADTPKAIFPFAGKPLAQHALDAAHSAGIHGVVVVVGYAREQVMEALGRPAARSERADGADAPRHAYVVQHEQMGTGHAVYLARAAIPRAFDGDVIVMYADNPGMDGALLAELLAAHRANKAKFGRERYGAMILTGSRRVTNSPGAANYGRIVRRGTLATADDGDNERGGERDTVVDIVEKKQIDRMADDDPRKRALDAIDEFNSGVVIARAAPYFEALGGVCASRTKAERCEYYATDFVRGMVARGLVVDAWQVSPAQQYKLEGANTLEELRQLERRWQGGDAEVGSEL